MKPTVKSSNLVWTLVVAAFGISPAFAGGAHLQSSARGPLPPEASKLVDTGPMQDAAAGIAKKYSGTPIDVLTFHYDTGRTGWNRSETDLTPASVASGKFGLLKTLNVDGTVWGQPLLASGLIFPDGSTHDVLVVATGHDSVYAFDAKSYALLWQVSLGTSQSSNDVGCGDVQPEYGISGTPAILRTAPDAATLYLVAATEPSPGVFHQYLHALDLTTGLDVRPAVDISPSAKLLDGSKLTFDPQNQWNRVSLAAGNGSIYVGFGSHCDANSGSISGWLLRFDPSLAPMAAFHTIETSGGTELASIWMSGFAPALDQSGNLFVVTGNGDVASKQRDWGESALSLTPSLSRVRSRFTPSDFATLNGGDQDFGSGGIMLLPISAGQTAPPMAVAMGKAATLYLLNQTKLGGLTSNDSGALQSVTITQQFNAGLWGGPAYYSGANGPTVYAQTNGDVLRAFKVAVTGTPSLTQTVTGTTQSNGGGSMPIISSNGSAVGTGVLWEMRRTLPIELEAYNADSLGAPIFSANAGTLYMNKGNPFLTPMEANGRVYAAAYKTVKVFGLKP